MCCVANMLSSAKYNSVLRNLLLSKCAVSALQQLPQLSQVAVSVKVEGKHYTIVNSLLATSLVPNQALVLTADLKKPQPFMTVVLNAQQQFDLLFQNLPTLLRRASDKVVALN